MKCHFCGKQHEMLKSKCPAFIYKQLQLFSRCILNNSGLIKNIGNKSSQFINILTFKKNLEHVLHLKLSNVIDDYPYVFKNEYGQLSGEAHCITDPSVTPVVLPVRRIPVLPAEKVKPLSAKNAITPVHQPNDGSAMWLLL